MHATIVIFSVVVMIRSIELNEVYTVYTTFHYFWTMKRVPLRKSVKKCIVFIFNNLHNSLIMKFPSSLSLSKAKDNFTFQTHNIDHLDNIFKSIWMSRFRHTLLEELWKAKHKKECRDVKSNKNSRDTFLANKNLHKKMAQKWHKIAQKWPQMTQNFQNGPKMTQNGPKISTS